MDEKKLIKELKKWLGPDGLKFFKDLKEKYGTVLAIWNEGDIPHVVHFIEGMQVRNKLRELTNYSWADNDYDNKWSELVEKCL